MIRSDPRAREKPCLRCGYSLRKVTDGQHCPECGLSVWLSLNQNDTLEVSNPDWLRRMQLGVWIMIVSLCAASSVMALASVQEMRFALYRQAYFDLERKAMMDSDNPQAWAGIFALEPPVMDERVLRVALMVGVVALLGYHAGLLVLTSPEGRYPDRLAGFRAGAWGVTALAALVAIFLARQSVAFNPRMAGEWALRLACVGAAMLTWGYMGRLARRIPHPKLARVCGWMTFVPLVSVGYSFIRHSDWPPDLLPVVYLPVSVGLLVWCATLLRRTAWGASRAWAAETAGGTP
jgi:hypothetical protein